MDIHFKYGSDICKSEIEVDDEQINVFSFFPCDSKDDWWDCLTPETQEDITDAIADQYTEDCRAEAESQAEADGCEGYYRKGRLR